MNVLMSTPAPALFWKVQNCYKGCDPRRTAGPQALMTDRIPSAASHEATVDDSGPLPSTSFMPSTQG
ncbi:hypothetical protein CC77DRAFT_212955 [Alternaria alternata]|uniref:Uncharacterized protein n=1 Tax=Alternaria alternata TaxID=5599 RepID=A0A177DFU0_ALTAL|nr:hypothetical protein CC77DRAFT_212955 [Alternaria alternata]OAG18121.1 hypothetical protein CC77DRAFT_212955 [Alternaria alternata]